MDVDKTQVNSHELFKALGSETRLEILRLLSRQALCVGALAARLDITQSAASQHLQVLRRAGLVAAEKRGYYVHYRLSDQARDLCETAISQLFG
jgi:ArsR family transcriptional regulator